MVSLMITKILTTLTVEIFLLYLWWELVLQTILTVGKNALLITEKGTINNIPNVGNVSNVESCVIMPEVGEHHNYGSDCAAAQAGVPLYGLYHTAGVLKIRITECGSGNPPTTTTSTSRSNPGTTGPRYLIERCGDNAQYYNRCKYLL